MAIHKWRKDNNFQTNCPMDKYQCGSDKLTYCIDYDIWHENGSQCPITHFTGDFDFARNRSDFHREEIG
jgi:hypothetical protein